jgi:hypothetical protein
MSRLVWRQTREDFWRNGIALIDQLLQPPGHRDHIMKDHQIRYQVIVADDFALLFTVVLANDALAPKRDPLDETIPRFGGLRPARLFGKERDQY